MQQNVIKHGAKHVSALILAQRNLNGFGYCAAQRTAGIGVFGQYFSSDLSRIGGRRNDVCAVGLHYGLAVRLLLAADFYHINVQFQAVEGACHGQRRSPLSRARLCGKRGQSLLLCVVGLRDRGIKLMRSGGIVSLKFVVDFSRSIQHSF